ncbi:MAG: prepilin peptidase, partial [Burkholderiaceae bacterium]|nr:prepilin peptidase [Burkholderiaceae bacterium]
MSAAAFLLPHRGLAFGSYPQRRERVRWPLLQALMRRLASACGRPHASTMPATVQAALDAAAETLRGAGEAALQAQIVALRDALRRHGLTDAQLGRAIALAGEVMARTLGKRPYPTQQRAAWLMLRGQLIEMATGEGKTLATSLAAGIAALGGAPVHVLTANDYLVQRDRALQKPFYDALGLSSAFVTAALERDERAAAWRHDIVYATARELAFDYLRDHAALAGERDARVLRAAQIAADDDGAAQAATEPVLPGLCLCVIDEADSILLDEAVVPLILAAPSDELDADGYRCAFAIAAGLQRYRDYTLDHARRSAQLTDAGRDAVAQALGRNARGVLRPLRRACELVESALAARLLFRRGREYAVIDGELVLIDELTGRIADGRRWSGALHPMVEIKEALAPTPPSVTSAQITYQRFFPRYLRLCGLSGTLLEARHELRVLYDLRCRRVPLARPSRMRWLGERCLADGERKWAAVVTAVRVPALAGRPVLVGTDSVADSERLSSLLTA